jgi:hypothetical protein
LNAHDSITADLSAPILAGDDFMQGPGQTKGVGMKKTVNRSAVVLLIGILTSATVLAETIKQKVTFRKPVVVNGTVVQKGTYDAIFDDQTNELSITQKKKVIAKSPARLEERNGKEPAFIVFREEGNQNVLVTVSFKKSQATLLSNVTKATATP